MFTAFNYLAKFKAIALGVNEPISIVAIMSRKTSAMLKFIRARFMKKIK